MAINFWNWQKKIILEKIDSPLGDELEILVKKVERFAPQDMRIQRAEFYYNYAMLPSYLLPLVGLLRVISTRRNYKQMDQDFAKEVFICLKRFYDIKDRYTLENVISDQRFLRKYRELFTIFYGKAGPKKETLDQWILDIKAHISKD